MKEDLFQILGELDHAETARSSAGSATDGQNGLDGAPANRLGASRRSTPSLHSFLAERYPLRDRRRTARSKYRPLKIDDRGQRDVIPNFCDINVAIPLDEDGSFLLELNNVPWDVHVLALIEPLVQDRQARLTNVSGQVVVQLRVTYKQHGFVRKLANTIGQVSSSNHVKRTGVRYPDPNWKWLAKRTKNSLIILATAMKTYRQLATN